MFDALKLSVFGKKDKEKREPLDMESDDVLGDSDNEPEGVVRDDITGAMDSDDE